MKHREFCPSDDPTIHIDASKLPFHRKRNGLLSLQQVLPISIFYSSPTTTATNIIGVHRAHRPPPVHAPSQTQKTLLLSLLTRQQSESILVVRIFHSLFCWPLHLHYQQGNWHVQGRNNTLHTPASVIFPCLIERDAFISSSCRTPHPLRWQFTRSHLASSVYFDPQPINDLYPPARANGIISSLRIIPVFRCLIAASNCLIC